MYWSNNWLSIDTRISSIPSHIKESFATESDREDTSITKRILLHLSTLLGKAFKILMACHSLQGGKAQFVAHTTDKGKGKEQTAMLRLQIKVIFCFVVTDTALVRQLYSPPTIQPQSKPTEMVKKNCMLFWKITISNIVSLCHCWTVM